MSFAVTLTLVLVAVVGLTSLLLSLLVAVAWHTGLDRARLTAGELLGLRLLPTAGAAFIALTVVLPAFLVYEPAHEIEEGGPLLAALSLLALLTVGDGIRRASHACATARTLFRRCGAAARGSVMAGQRVYIVDVPEPMVAVIGGWRQRILASDRVLAACSAEEFCQVMAHEMAHVAARDNLKLLLLVFAPDVLAWLPAEVALTRRWRVAAEREADERATGADRRKRIALASALIKVARLSTAAQRPVPALSMPIAVDDVEGRVRALLSPSSNVPRNTGIWAVAACALLIPVGSVPLYGLVHQLIEALVAYGR